MFHMPVKCDAGGLYVLTTSNRLVLDAITFLHMFDLQDHFSKVIWLELLTEVA